jgi:hypothetical protein
MEFLVNNRSAGIVPASSVTVLSHNLLYAQTFTVWRPGLKPGSHVVKLRFLVAPVDTFTPVGVAGARTLTVQMFTP